MKKQIFKTIKVFLALLLAALSFVLVFDLYGFRSFGIYLAQWHIYSWIPTAALACSFYFAPAASCVIACYCCCTRSEAVLICKTKEISPTATSI